MRTQFLLSMSTWLLPLGLCLGSGTVAAQRVNHPAIRILPIAGNPGARPVSALASDPYFKGLQAAFAEAYPTVSVNADGSDLWPCVGGTSPNADCPTVGNPAITLPGNALVVGFPAFGFALQNTPSIGNGIGCDAFVDGTGANGNPYEPCAQILTWHEDNTSDTTDDVLWRVTVTQGDTVIYASGVVDFGPIGPNVPYPLHIVISDDANLGYWPGAQTGPNNGNCFGSEYYPLAKPAFPGGYYVIASGKTCGRPQPGPAQVVSHTILATPSYTKISGSACTAKGVQSPCYAVKYTRQHEIRQNFAIELN